MSLFTKATLATALAASALAGSSPAMARGYYGGWGHRHHGGDDAAIAVGAGIVGLALGAIIASSNDNHRRVRDGGYYDDRYYNDTYRRDGWRYRDGYYYDRDGRRYDRDDWRRDYGDRYYRSDRYGNDYNDYYSRRGY